MMTVYVLTQPATTQILATASRSLDTPYQISPTRDGTAIISTSILLDNQEDGSIIASIAPSSAGPWTDIGTHRASVDASLITLLAVAITVNTRNQSIMNIPVPAGWWYKLRAVANSGASPTSQVVQVQELTR